MGTPARPMNQNDPVDLGAERKNLALELNRGDGGPLLEHAPESERSEAFSMPVSESDPNSARQGFNQL